MRALLALTFLAVALLAQDGDPRIDRALKVETSPKDRVELLDVIAATDRGAKALATRGLQPELAAEVVHAVVDALFRSGRQGPHLEAIVRLLASEKHRLRVLHRLQEAARGPQGTALVGALGEMARGITAAAGKEEALRVNAVRALGWVPRRAALEVIVAVWARADETAAVRAECRAAVQDVLAQKTAEAAAAYLERNPYHSYLHFLRERMQVLEDEVERLRPFQSKWLLKAPADETLESLENAGAEARGIAARRLGELAKADRFAPISAADFATRTLDAAVRERDRRPRAPQTLATLLGALRHLWGTDKPGPLRSAPADSKDKLLALVQPLTSGGRGLEPVGEACVSLLYTMKASGMLAEFARRFDAPGVRRKAVQALGNLVGSVDGAGKAFIRDRLLDLLADDDKTAPVRAQLLFSLAENFDSVPQAQDAVRKLLQESGTEEGGTTLPAAEVRSCVKILRKTGEDAAFAALVELSRTHPSLDVRRAVIEDGLLPWAARNGKGTEVFAQLRALALASDATPAQRSMIVKALGGSANRSAHAVLVELASADAFDEKARLEAKRAKFALGTALVRGGRIRVTEADVAIALRILEEERDTDSELAQALAQRILTAANQASLKPLQARYRIATAYMARKPDDGARIIELLSAAADNAAGDGLAPAFEAALLRDLVARLEKAASHRVASRHCKRLAELAKATPRDEAGWLLRAAENALNANDKAAAAECLKAAEDLKALDEAGAAKLAELKKRAAG